MPTWCHPTSSPAAQAPADAACPGTHGLTAACCSHAAARAVPSPLACVLEQAGCVLAMPGLLPGRAAGGSPPRHAAGEAQVQQPRSASGRAGQHCFATALAMASVLATQPAVAACEPPRAAWLAEMPPVFAQCECSTRKLLFIPWTLITPHAPNQLCAANITFFSPHAAHSHRHRRQRRQHGPQRMESHGLPFAQQFSTRAVKFFLCCQNGSVDQLRACIEGGFKVNAKHHTVRTGSRCCAPRAL